MMMDLVIEKGLIVTGAGVFEGDVGIRGEKIAAVASTGMFPEAASRIDASGMYVLPGAIDTHAHIEEPFQGCVPEEDWTQATRAAARGGTTSVFNFVIQEKGRALADLIQTHKARAGRLSLIDFNFHGVFTDFSDLDAATAEIPRLFDLGVTSVKQFMIYSREGLATDDWALYNIMREVSAQGGIVGVHAENCAIGEGLTARLAGMGRTRATDWPRAKPPFVEAEAAQRAAMIAEFAQANLYIVHTSTRDAVQIIGGFRARGLPVFLETCPHYLTFTEERLSAPDGKYQVVSPPLRRREDVDALWKALAEGTISIVGSDHNAYGRKDKDPGYERSGFMGVANGQPGILEILAILHSEGVRNGRISLPRMVEVSSTNAAKMFGIYPQKGTIAPGSDADLVIFDPRKEATLGSNLYEAADTSFYEGMRVTGFPVATLVRGRVVVRGGELLAGPGSGRFVAAAVRPGMYAGIR
jgi:dihydropyrimidinase